MDLGDGIDRHDTRRDDENPNKIRAAPSQNVAVHNDVCRFYRVPASVLAGFGFSQHFDDHVLGP